MREILSPFEPGIVQMGMAIYSAGEDQHRGGIHLDARFLFQSAFGQGGDSAVLDSDVSKERCLMVYELSIPDLMHPGNYVLYPRISEGTVS
jgi:hypothetical protein